jgi:hypothetical protein
MPANAQLSSRNFALAVSFWDAASAVLAKPENREFLEFGADPGFSSSFHPHGMACSGRCLKICWVGTILLLVVCDATGQQRTDAEQDVEAERNILAAARTQDRTSQTTDPLPVCSEVMSFQVFFVVLVFLCIHRALSIKKSRLLCCKSLTSNDTRSLHDFNIQKRAHHSGSFVYNLLQGLCQQRL